MYVYSLYISRTTMKADPSVSTFIIRLHACTETRKNTGADARERSRGMQEALAPHLHTGVQLRYQQLESCPMDF